MKNIHTRIDGMQRLEFYQRLQRNKAIGDDRGIMVTDTHGGQMVSAINAPGAEDESVFNITPYWFIVTFSSATYVRVSDGYFVHGGTVEYVPTTLVLRSSLFTGYINLVAYYRLFNETWTFDYESSVEFPNQMAYPRDGNANPAERFPVAYISFGDGEISQINVKEIRTMRAG